MLPADVVKKVLESIETGDMETTGIYLSEGLACRGFAPEVLGKKQFLELISALYDAIPNWSFNADGMDEKGNAVKVKVRITGTHTGELHLPSMGVAHIKPTGVRIKLPEERLDCTARDNKIQAMRIEQVAGGGLTGIFKQLGIRVPEKVAV